MVSTAISCPRSVTIWTSWPWNGCYVWIVEISSRIERWSFGTKFESDSSAAICYQKLIEFYLSNTRRARYLTNITSKGFDIWKSLALLAIAIQYNTYFRWSYSIISKGIQMQLVTFNHRECVSLLRWSQTEIISHQDARSVRISILVNSHTCL